MDKPRIKQQLRRGFFALAIVGALLTVPKAQAQPIPASGSTTDCEHVISVRTAGRNTIITLEITVCFHGTFEGTWVGTERDRFHADGTGTIQGSGVFSGTVNGRSGTMVFSYEVSVTRNGDVTHWVVNQGTGDLAGLSGQGTFQNDVEHGPGCRARCRGRFHAINRGRIRSSNRSLERFAIHPADRAPVRVLIFPRVPSADKRCRVRAGNPTRLGTIVFCLRRYRGSGPRRMCS